MHAHTPQILVGRYHIYSQRIPNQVHMKQKQYEFSGMLSHFWNCLKHLNTYVSNKTASREFENKWKRESVCKLRDKVNKYERVGWEYTSKETIKKTQNHFKRVQESFL